MGGQRREKRGRKKTAGKAEERREEGRGAMKGFGGWAASQGPLSKSCARSEQVSSSVGTTDHNYFEISHKHLQTADVRSTQP